ncbi:hypothetical protein ACHAXT_010706 [Thalassiosira profunda]
MADQGPPQEGLDPKLGLLPDLAPAAYADDALAADPLARDGLAAFATAGEAEGPPQEGRDPKLRACVTGGGAAGEGAADGAGASAAAPRADVAAAMLSIQNTSQSPPQPAAAAADEDPREPRPSNAAKKENPNLTSSERLDEWRKIHDGSGPNYDFFKKSQDAKLAAAKAEAEREGEALEEFAAFSEARKAEALSKARAGVPPTEGAAADLKPLFTLQPEGAAAPSKLPAYPGTAAPAPTKGPLPPQKQSNTNSNFWLHDEEERFLLGLRLYGWGQWKRIQTVVQTRTNKQIKSHAQKREKINPEIKAKYGRGTSRRGRISSKVLAADVAAMAQAGGTTGAAARALLATDAAAPSYEEAWRDVYGTNNGDGPNSRMRRHRHRQGPRAAATAPPPSGAAAANDSSQGLALLELGRAGGKPGEAPVLTAQPAYAYPPVAHAPPAFAPPPPTHASNAVESPSKQADTSALRPGMSVCARYMGNTAWCPGTIYSSKVDPAKLSNESPAGAVPLVYHIQFENGNEDPDVPEESIMSADFYNAAVDDLERCHTIPLPEGHVSKHPHPIAGGTPVYCQWRDRSNPNMHGQWLPATINSSKQLEDGSCAYHVLFDNEEERQDVPGQCVLERSEYDSLMQSPTHQGQMASARSIEELQALFRRQSDAKEGVADLLLTASQMDSSGSKRGAPAGAEQGKAKRQATSVLASV